MDQVRQAKTDELVDVPVHARLEPLLRARMARKVMRRESGKEVISTLLVPSPRGYSWTRRNFSRAWDGSSVAQPAGWSGSFWERG